MRNNNHYSINGWHIEDSENNILFTIFCKDELAQRIINKLNDKSVEKFNSRQKMNAILIDNVIVLKISDICQFVNIFNVSKQEAIIKQINLMKFIVEKLNS